MGLAVLGWDLKCPRWDQEIWHQNGKTSLLWRFMSCCHRVAQKHEILMVFDQAACKTMTFIIKYAFEPQCSINYVSSSRFLDHYLSHPKTLPKTTRNMETMPWWHTKQTEGLCLGLFLGQSVASVSWNRRLERKKSLQSNLLERCSIGPKAWRILESGEGSPLHKGTLGEFATMFFGCFRLVKYERVTRIGCWPHIARFPEFAENCNF